LIRNAIAITRDYDGLSVNGIASATWRCISGGLFIQQEGAAMPNQVVVEIRERVTSHADGTHRAWVDLAIPDLDLRSRVLIRVCLTKREAQLQAAMVVENVRMARGQQVYTARRAMWGR
jgi:hypothetical protein